MSKNPISNKNFDEEKLSSLARKRALDRFSIIEIQLATQNFDDNLVIGKGGFGNVYKGRIGGTGDTIGRLVAIKRLDSFSRQGASEFITEIEMLSKLRHCHLVSLIGYCLDMNEHILVYEYMSNGTIEHHLHKADTPLSWINRLKISIDAAQGLDYLHTGVDTQNGIIHRDVKSSNILLDENWAAKISDFGLSKIIDERFSGVSTGLKGTFGYLDPEYSMTGHLTRKSDVYSFGVVLFELLSGRRAVDTMLREEEWNLANWAKRCVKERRLNQVVSSHIKTQISSKCLKEFVQIARRCLKSSRKKRPTMADVVVALQQSLALQEHFNSAAQAAGSTGFTHKMQNLLFGSRHNSGDPETPSSTHDGLSEYSLRVFSYRDMKLATRNFSSRMLLGHGHYGEVFRGWLHKKTYCPSMSDSGLPVAIKRLYTHKFKPDMVKEEDFDAQRSEFRREVELLAKIGHRNIVKLLGYVDKENELLIITEYVTNGTLREHLDGVHGSYLDFVQRLEICIDIAHGLTYLHLYAGKQIIHRDIKSSNILLTERLKAIVADFGFATLGETDKTHVVTKVRGTVGYLDPEYMRTYELTSKSDVYSFGILLIEILTGRSPIEYKRPPEEKVTVTWASGKYKEGDITDLVDPQMKESLETEIFVNMLKLAFQCVAPTRADRPDINVVAEKLWAIRIDSLRNGRK